MVKHEGESLGMPRTALVAATAVAVSLTILATPAAAAPLRVSEVVDQVTTGSTSAPSAPQTVAPEPASVPQPQRPSVQAPPSPTVRTPAPPERVANASPVGSTLRKTGSSPAPARALDKALAVADRAAAPVSHTVGSVVRRATDSPASRAVGSVVDRVVSLPAPGTVGSIVGRAVGLPVSGTVGSIVDRVVGLPLPGSVGPILDGAVGSAIGTPEAPGSVTRSWSPVPEGTAPAAGVIDPAARTFVPALGGVLGVEIQRVGSSNRAAAAWTPPGLVAGVLPYRGAPAYGATAGQPRDIATSDGPGPTHMTNLLSSAAASAGGSSVAFAVALLLLLTLMIPKLLLIGREAPAILRPVTFLALLERPG
jgi:hypothetical protein